MLSPVEAKVKVLPECVARVLSPVEVSVLSVQSERLVSQPVSQRVECLQSVRPLEC